MVHRVAWEDLVPHRESEVEAKDNAGLACPVVALLRELLQEEVAARHPDLSQRDFFEEREDEGAHVPLVQQPCRR